MPYYKINWEGSEIRLGNVSFSADDENDMRQHFDTYMEENFPEIFEAEIINFEEIND